MIFGEPRVPFERPVQATAGYHPRSMDTAFIAAEQNPFPQIMAARLARLPSGVHQPLAAEPGSLPGTAPVPVTPQPPNPTKIRRKATRMLPIPLLMTVGMFSPPRSGLRAGLNPAAMVAAGQRPGI